MKLKAFAVLSACIALGSLPAQAADPVGTYVVTGYNPGRAGGYTGTVTVTRTGNTFQVVWTVDTARYVGTAIGDNTVLAVSYGSGGESGVALYSTTGLGWVGRWATANGTQLGGERWTRR